MLFNSLEFLLFLPSVFVLYWFVFKQHRWQNAFVVIASYMFYGWWDWRFLTLIAFTTLCSYLTGLFIGGAKGGGGQTVVIRTPRKVLCALNIIINLLILGAFKYYNFFAESFAEFAKLFLGVRIDWATLNIVLPVGISFYTFQALSYSIDVYRGRIEPTKDLVAFAAFISFFPQLVAGPIERATNLLPQFLKGRVFNYPVAVDGMRQILWGLFKKMVIADNCAQSVNIIFESYGECGSLELALGAVLFAFQIYGDFSGYSDIAIGSAKLFGIELKRNFNHPYFSRSVSEFWRRWHISLQTWFVDYIYIPLGGSRRGKLTTIRNTFIVFGVSGLWHGANWTFVCWGLYHAILFLPSLIAGRKRPTDAIPSEGKLLPAWGDAVRMLATFALVTLGWVIFRAPTIVDAAGYINGIFSGFSLEVPVHGKFAAALLIPFVAVEWLQRDKQHALQFSGCGIFRFRAVRWILYLTLFAGSVFFAGGEGQFIYFQF